MILCVLSDLMMFYRGCNDAIYVCVCVYITVTVMMYCILVSVFVIWGLALRKRHCLINGVDTG